MYKILALISLLTLCEPWAQARVFGLNQQQFGSYFLISGSQAPIKDSPWVMESTADASSKSYGTTTGGEFGFTYATKFLSWRFGFEVIKPTKLSAIAATQAGTTVYQIASDITGYAPKLGIEITPWSNNKQKVFIFSYVGTASVSIKNDYSTLTIAPNIDHSVEMAGSGNLLGAGLGYELHAFDTTSLILEVGYRILKIDNFKYSKDVTTFAGAVTAGQSVLKTDGSNRSVDFGGSYVTLGLRFWIF